MRRYLLVALWPAGLAAIAAVTVIAARRAPVLPALAVVDDSTGQGGPVPAGPADEAGRDADLLAEVTDAESNGAARPTSATALIAGICGLHSDSPAALPDWVPDLVRLGAITCAGGVLSYGVMALLGRPIVKYGPMIDEPILRWTDSHQVKQWAAVMERFNKIGNTWTIWGAAGAAAACLAVTWRQNKWLPPASLGAAIVVDHYVTRQLRRRFRRLGPPTSPLGTYPSGGCDRVVLFYGLIANMLWREFSGSHRGKALAVGAVAGLSFNVAYCREYLSRHWFTDIITGLFYGVVLLVPFSAAVRLIAGPANVKVGQGRAALAVAMAA
jgi:membrane-associated phospholipid phosphatase